MAAIELRVQKIGDDELLDACFESIEDAKTWLRERPKFMQVFGVSSPRDLDETVEEELHAAMRPFDDEEKQRRKEAYDAKKAEIRAQNLAEDQLEKKFLGWHDED